jgi:hypothetical protein
MPHLVVHIAIALVGAGVGFFSSAGDQDACGPSGKECHPTTIGTAIVIALPMAALAGYVYWRWRIRSSRRR